MATAGERLATLAGATGTAAALLLAIGTGPTAGAALVDYSGLPSATAAEHLLAEHVPLEQAAEMHGGKRKRVHTGLTPEEVRQQWELLELRRGAASLPQKPDPKPEGAPTIVERGAVEPARLSGEIGAVVLPLPDGLLPAPMEAAPLPAMQDMALPITIEQQQAALDAKRQQNAAALVALLSEL